MKKYVDLLDVYVFVATVPDYEHSVPIFLEKKLRKLVNHVPYVEYNDGISLRVGGEMYNKLLPYCSWAKDKSTKVKTC